MFSMIITERTLVCNITTPMSVTFFGNLPAVASTASGKTKATKRTDANPKDEKEKLEETIGKSRPETARSPRSRIKR